MKFLNRQAGAILFENSQGFVSVDYFESSEDLENEWNEIVEEIGEAEEDEDY